MEKRSQENAFVYIHEISYSPFTIVPNDPKTFTLEDMTPKETPPGVSP